MTLTPTLKWIIAIAVAILAFWAFRSWLAERDLRMKTQATVATNQAIAQTNQAASKVLQDAMDARDKDTNEKIATLDAAIAKIQTPQQIIKYVAKDLAPAAQIPLTVVIPPSTAANPHPDAVIDIPQADLPAVRDRLNACDVSAIAIANCQADGVTKAQQLKDAGAALVAMTNERDAYKQEVAGGTKWTRLKKAAKYLGVGAAIGAAAVCGSGHCK